MDGAAETHSTGVNARRAVPNHPDHNSELSTHVPRVASSGSTPSHAFMYLSSLSIICIEDVQ